MTSLRTRLFHGTAVAAMAVMPEAIPAAPALPNNGTVTVGTVKASVPVANTGQLLTDGTDAGHKIAFDPMTTVVAGDKLSLAVGTADAMVKQSAVVEWGSFDIGAANAVTFTQPGNLPFSVLNRVSGPLTTIAGVLQGNADAVAGNRGTIFVINESGITFANSATVTNLSGFVASSLGVTNEEFAKFGSEAIRFTGTGSSAISIDADGATKATIAPDSVLLLVAPALAVKGGQLTATLTEGVPAATTYGDVGVVLAADARIALNPTSIISVAIDKGTSLTDMQVLDGTIAGKRVQVAAASQSDVTGVLLSVPASITAMTATAADNGIVLAVGGDTSGTVSFAAPALGPPVVIGAQFAAGLAVGGSLTSSGRIDATSTGTATLAQVTATGVASFTAAGRLTLAGDVAADGGLAGVGGDLVLGTDGETHSLSSKLGLTLRSVTGDIAAVGTLSIAAATDGNALGDLILDTAGAISGAPALTGGTDAARTAVAVRQGDPTKALTLGAVRGATFGNTDYVTAGDPGSGYALTGLIASQGDITTGAVTVDADISLVSTGGNIVTGVLTSGHGVTVSASAWAKPRPSAAPARRVMTRMSFSPPTVP